MNRIVNAFPIWVSTASLLALIHPPLFTWFHGWMIKIGLAIIMLGMGLTLQWPDFQRVFRAPKPILAGVSLQYLLMPGLGWTAGQLFGLPAPFTAGLILVSCCPGGTASNVIAYLARADVALSVSMTAISTLFAVLLTPTLTTLLLDSQVDVDPMGLFIGTLEVVLLPVATGLFLRKVAPQSTKKILPVAPVASVVMIVLIVATIIGAQRTTILESGASLLAAVLTVHGCGFLLGWLVASWVQPNRAAARTIAIEVGMQNSGLGVVLAKENFANPLVAVPCAISSIVHCVIGSMLAAIWSRIEPKADP